MNFKKKCKKKMYQADKYELLEIIHACGESDEDREGFTLYDKSGTSDQI